MLNQLDSKTISAIESCNRLDSFIHLKGWLQDSLPQIGELTVKSSGEAKIEYSGAYKVIEELLGMLSLEMFNELGPVDKHFE